MNKEMFTCIYCNGEASSKLMLVQVYAPGTYFQHWDLETQKGCKANKENKSPMGQIIKPRRNDTKQNPNHLQYNN
jgi:hypothetical protein